MEAAVGDLKLVDENQLSSLIGVKVDTLRFWRQNRTGPPYIKMGHGRNSPVRYRPADVIGYFDKHTITSEYDPAA